MADYEDDVKKFTTTVDIKALEGLEKTYALVMSKADTRYVAASDEDEVQRVVDNFCKKKLGRKESDEKLLEVVEGVLAAMKATKMKPRVVVYYLVAEKLGALAAFH
jgi:hypothetical protein